MRREIIIAFIFVVTLVVSGYAGYRRYGAEPEAIPPPVVVTQETTAIVSASGEVVPARWAQLSFEIGGTVQELAVEEGDEVEAGQVLARLDDSDLQQAVNQARSALAVAQAQLARVKAGARPEEIAAAQEAVAGAEANLTAARAALKAAQARLARLKVGARPEEIAVAEAQVQQAATELAHAQNVFDRFRWATDEDNEELRYLRDAAGAAHATAQAQLDLVRSGAANEEIEMAQAQVDQAQAQAEAAEAQVRQARAQLALLQAGASAEEMAVAQAQVEQARVALERAEVALDKATLKAPFAGTVARLWLRQGEATMPGQPVITLGDLSHLWVETTDLNEEDVAQVKVGQRARITLDALPGKELSGRVIRIAPMATVGQGGTNYTVTIELDETDPDLRWGMTAYVDIGG